MKVTTFNAVKNTNKKPTSPYSPKGSLRDHFDFSTVEVSSLKECFEILVNNWILTNPICISETLVSPRRKKELSEHRCSTPGAIVLDIDNITSYDDMVKIINIFKKSDFNIILGKSKNWDGNIKFNLKGFIEVQYTNTWRNSEKFLIILSDMIGNSGKIDLNAATDVSAQAPLYRNEVLLHKLDSTLKIDDDYILMNTKYINTKKENKFIQTFDTSKLVHLCYDIYMKNGFYIFNSSGNSNTINWGHINEVKSKGSYFTYIDSPHIMHHPVKEKTFNIYNEIRQTKEGQEFIKEQSSYALKKQFEENRKIYSNEMKINQKLIDVNFNMKRFIKQFLNNGDILKIKSAMGTGKSLIINEVINECKMTKKRILLVSNRISVAMDYASKYDIKTYLQSGDENWIPGEDLIVQLDSLWKYDLRNFDIVILDEFVSLMFQSLSSLQEDIKPFNIAKFYHILKNKKIVLADAFISGYEDIFYDKKEIYYIQNDYRDEIDITYYENHNIFVESIIEKLKNKDINDTVTASIMSTNIINTVYDICTDMGFKVFKLTSNTSDDVKKIIYNIFDNDINDKWDLLLFSPTLTVGVSNMNNCTHHFHYDGGNAADVISSLQMVKRSRKMKHLHLFLKERVSLEPTESDTLDDLFNQNIERYFKGKSNGVMIDVDTNGNFTLSNIGKFNNKIQALHNRLENNHKMSFNVLLTEQFKPKNIITLSNKGTLKLATKIKQTKENIKKIKIDNIEHHTFTYSDNIDDLLKSGRTLSESEKIDIALYELSNKINTNDKDVLISIAKADISSDYKLLNKITNIIIVYKKNLLYINNEIDRLLTSGVKSSDFRDRTNFLKDVMKIFKMNLKEWYSENDIKKIDEEYKLYDFRSLLINIGYKKRTNRWTIDEDVKKYFKYFL